jgi:hypothetical protein
MIWDAVDSVSLLDELRYKGYGTCVIAPVTYAELDLNNDGYNVLELHADYEKGDAA